MVGTLAPDLAAAAPHDGTSNANNQQDSDNAGNGNSSYCSLAETHLGGSNGNNVAAALVWIDRPLHHQRRDPPIQSLNKVHFLAGHQDIIVGIWWAQQRVWHLIDSKSVSHLSHNRHSIDTLSANALLNGENGKADKKSPGKLSAIGTKIHVWGLTVIVTLTGAGHPLYTYM